MKPSAFRIERLLAKVEAEVARRGLRARRYVFHPDEVAEAEAQGVAYVLLPSVSSSTWLQGFNSSKAGGALEPIQEVRIHEQQDGLVKRRSMRRIMARRMKAATVRA